MTRKVFLVLMMIAVVLTAACISEEKTSLDHVAPLESESVSEVKAAPSFADTEAKIAQYLNDGTEYAVYLAYPQKSSEAFIYNSHRMRSASMIKVFIMATVLEKAKQGEIDINEKLTLLDSDKVGGAGILAGYDSGTELSLRELMELMIIHSDNTATNMIIDRIGCEEINAYMERNGYSDSFLGRKMMSHVALVGNGENYSSARDLGIFFTRLYNYECVSKQYDKIMIDFLLKQTDTDCFPAALPGKQIAHKTGALDDLYDDGGIIYSDAGDAVLVIMTENFTGEYNTIQHMKAFARAVID